MIKSFKITIFALALSVIAFTGKQSYSATQGTLGATSQGSKDISVAVPISVKVTGFADTAFGTWSGTGALTDNNNLCIYSNNAGNYTVTAASANETGTSFRLYDTSTYIIYNVYWYSNDGGGDAVASGTSLSEGTTLAGQTGASATSHSCVGATGNVNAALGIEIPEANLAAATGSGTNFTDTLTVTVAPV